MGYFDSLREAIKQTEDNHKAPNQYPNLYDLRIVRTISTDVLAELSKSDGIKKIVTITRYGITSEIMALLSGYYGQVEKCFIRVYGHSSLTDIHRLADKAQEVLGEFSEVKVAEITESDEFVINLILLLR